jgi:hypothetical protein
MHKVHTFMPTCLAAFLPLALRVWCAGDSIGGGGSTACVALSAMVVQAVTATTPAAMQPPSLAADCMFTANLLFHAAAH